MATGEGRSAKQQVVTLALRWLENQDFSRRKRWADRAEQLGVEVGPASTAPTNLKKWVPAIAATLVAEEGLAPPPPV